MPIFIYLFNRLSHRFLEFFQHWYLNSFRVYGHFVISVLEKLDRRFALKITLRHLFIPLYQDRSLIGYVLGFFFRFGRLILGSFVYLILLAIAAFFYFVWLAIPVFIIFKIISSI